MRENQNGYGMKNKMQSMVSTDLCLSRRKRSSVSATPARKMRIKIARYFSFRSSCTFRLSISCGLALDSGVSSGFGRKFAFSCNGDFCLGGEDGAECW